MTEDEQDKKMSQLVAKCWADDGFKRKFMADPDAVLKAEGIMVPAGVSVKAVEDTDTKLHFVIPAKPADLTDEELDKVAGGVEAWGCRRSLQACRR
jgi:hypothetical protein